MNMNKSLFLKRIALRALKNLIGSLDQNLLTKHDSSLFQFVVVRNLKIKSILDA